MDSSVTGTGNVFELNNHIVVDNAVDPSILMISNYNIYDVINNHRNNIINVNVVNNNFNDTFIYDDHNYYDDDFNGDENNSGEDVVSPEVDDSNPSSNNTKNNNITDKNYIKNSKLSKKRRTPNHLHVKFHEVDDRNDNYHNNVNLNVNSSCSGNYDSVANIGNNCNYDYNRDITAATAIDHDTNNTNSTFTTTSTTAIITSTSSTTNPTSNTATVSTTPITNDGTSNMMSTAATISTTTTNDDIVKSSYMYHGRLWTEEMDKELCTLHSSYKSEKDWAQRITNVINLKFHTTLTSSHISKRWTQYLRPELSKRKVGLWSETEIKQLHELVFINSYESKNIKGMIVVHWENVALALNRRYYDCQNKWNTIKKSTLKGKIYYI